MKLGLLFTMQDPPNGAHLHRLYDEVFEQASIFLFLRLGGSPPIAAQRKLSDQLDFECPVQNVAKSVFPLLVVQGLAGQGLNCLFADLTNEGTGAAALSPTGRRIANSEHQ